MSKQIKQLFLLVLVFGSVLIFSGCPESDKIKYKPTGPPIKNAGGGSGPMHEVYVNGEYKRTLRHNPEKFKNIP